MSGSEDGESERADPDILRGEDAPGKWRHRTVGGTIITWVLPHPYTIDGFDNIREGWVVELVLKTRGEYGDDNRPVDVLIVDYPPEHIINNYLDSATVIAEGCVGNDEAARVAVGFMQKNAGKERTLRATNAHE